MARRTKEDAQKTREQLLDAAEVVFHHKGVSETSLNDIAAEAGLTRGAVYWHFKNKHDVFVAMLERLDLPLESLHKALESPDEEDPLGKMREFLLYLVREIANDPKRQRVFEIVFLKCEMTEENEPLIERHRKGFLDSSGRMRRVLDNAVRRGQLPESLDIDRSILHLHVQLTGLIYLWLLLPEEFDFEGEAERVIDAYFSCLKQCFGNTLPS
ncbi:TetR family transcriptional regulator [Marinobacter zhejiangensis]|uniref:Transcriptional regulator, TetR family n=1 Tax=Marinobacter zhejiangensis TaxID=488535 RepID=A0A1I4Q989_9GAMM|nr:TetR family transcriptional regulator [Marinobacter zhejiangensis]SFM36193.1 transcriptional regulator, TetR family [Marinobacter zhejiangensis]